MTSLRSALDAHILYRQRTISNDSYVRAIRCYIEAFLTLAGVASVEELTPYAVNRFASAYEKNVHARSHVRHFLAFCRERYYRHTPQLEFAKSTGPRPPQILRGVAERRVHVWREQAAKAAEAMKLPHQRVIFLLGYLYGHSLVRLLTFSRKDLHDISAEMRGDLYDLLAAIPPESWGPDTAIFHPWLGTHKTTASKKWREWVGDRGAKFDDVVRAGQVDRALAGMAPRCEKAVAHVIINSLPGLTRSGMERMKRWWGV